MRIIIIGAVAAGTSAATEARRNDKDAEIVLYEKGSYISYSGCGMPYYLGGIIDDIKMIAPRDPAYFKKKHDVDVKIEHEVLSIHPETKTVQVKSLANEEVFEDHYDKLVMATGASAGVPPIEGAENKNVFTLRNVDDMKRIEVFIDGEKPKDVAIIGTGFIGLEMCENLMHRGMNIIMFERLPQVAPALDSDMAAYVQSYLEKKGVTVYTEASVSKITSNGVALGDDTQIKADMVLMATGVRPNSKIAESAGIELGVAGAIKVDQKLQTNIPDIYACGDCAVHYHALSGENVYRPLGSTANKTGKLTGDIITGKDVEFRGIIGTGICQMFDMAIAMTGLSEREANDLGYDIVVSRHSQYSKSAIMGGHEMQIKSIADKKTGRLIGAQIIGFDGVDKRIDVLATAITYKAQAADLAHLDLAYSPPYSTARDPIFYTGLLLEKALEE